MKTTSEDTQLLNVIPFKPGRPLTAGFSVLSKLQIGLLTPGHNDPESQPCVVIRLCWEEAVALDQLLQWSVTQVNTFKVQLQPGLCRTIDRAFTKQFGSADKTDVQLSKKGLIFKVALVSLSFILHTSTQVLKSIHFQLNVMFITLNSIWSYAFMWPCNGFQMINNCVLKHTTVVKHSFRLI